MIIRTFFSACLIATLFAADGIAQEDGVDKDRRDAETQLDLAAEMRAAEERLEEAARRIAELSTRQLPTPGGRQWAFAFSDRPMLGITLDENVQEGPVSGVTIRGVTPGGAAFDAGLRSGDTITSINSEAMSAASAAAANEKLLAFMDGLEEGDSLDIEYLRDGNVARVEVTPRANTEHHFAFGAPGHAPRAPAAPMAPIAPRALIDRQVFRWHGGMGWRDMELTPLTPDLGQYFGTDKGLLVVRAPAGGELQLKDGDVINSIDGREPESISHAMRILASYQPGEKIKLEIMRSKRRKTLDVEMPDDRQSGVFTEGDPIVKRVIHKQVVD
ncbi:MAG: PDZ domain-containing protein [Woeseia sp.]|nr:PDZ domain-containing protein [Woeseia sp.]MBT8097695.1 PDZ domain-containing protein [Woeseia sp.]NNE59995.1 PDZ domain-containing protein [Woeseia sp.]NNL55570.1 PDZ domain-containing protein [Woeseia sp.]